MKRFNALKASLTIEHLWVVAVMVGIIVFLNTQPIRPHDFWWHMAIGRDILSGGNIPLLDTYSYTQAGDPYLSYHQFWLMEVMLYKLFQAGGAILVVLAQTTMILPAYMLLMWISWRLTQNWRAAAFGVLFAAALGFGNWNVRPQAITYLFGALVLLGIIEFRLTHRRKWLVIFPVVMALWVNCHGSFPVGLALIGIWLADESWKVIINRYQHKQWSFQNGVPALVGFILALGGCLVNPRGAGVVSYISTMAGNSVVQNLSVEWLPPNINSWEGILFYVLFLMAVVILVLSPRRPSFYQIVTFLLFGILALKYYRSIVWFGIIMAPLLADHLAALMDKAGVKPAPKPTGRTKRLNQIFLLALLALAVISLPWFKPFWPMTPEKAGLISAETPIQATQYMLDNKLPPQVFHYMPFGSYLIWAAQPEYKVFVDSRIELYPMNIWNDYLTISAGGYDWEAKLDHYQISTLLLEPASQPGLIQAVGASSNWKEVYRDNQAVIFTRR
jgi:hypothetical protein